MTEKNGTVEKFKEEEHPDRSVFVIDSLSAGPELWLIVEKLKEYILSGMSYEGIAVTKPQPFPLKSRSSKSSLRLQSIYTAAAVFAASTAKNADL